MRVKITQPGWETFDDFLFGVKFEDGTSVTDVRRDQALQLGAMVSVIEVDDQGLDLGPVNPAHELVTTTNVSAEIVEPMKSDAELRPEVAPDVAIPDDKLVEKRVYTEAELVAIADEKGIAGLRDIGEPLKVKNTAIRGLIREILAAQGG